MRRTIFTLLAALTLALSSIGVAGAHTPPGNDGDACHGANATECRPDPQPSHGQDCAPHGANPDGNDDHCGSPSPSTPVITPSPAPSTAPSPSTTPTAPTPTTSPSETPSLSTLPSVAPSDVPSASPSLTPPAPSIEQPSSVPSTPRPTLPPTDAEPTSPLNDPSPYTGPLFVVSALGTLAYVLIMLTKSPYKR